MERTEAIQILSTRDWSGMLCGYTSGYSEALDMAIEALSKPNYESDTEVRLAVTNRDKDKVVLWDAFGEVEYYPNGEINCVHCPHYHETEDDTGVHSHCGGGDAEMNEVKSPYMQQTPNGATHGRLIDADELMGQWDDYLKMAVGNFPITPADITQIINDAPTVQADRPHGEWVKMPNGNIECSECRHQKGWYEKFCGFCGADMRGDK